MPFSGRFQTGRSTKTGPSVYVPKKEVAFVQPVLQYPEFQTLLKWTDLAYLAFFVVYRTHRAAHVSTASQLIFIICGLGQSFSG